MSAPLKVYSASYDKTVCAWDVNSKSVVGKLEHASFVGCIAVAPDGRVASGSADETVIISSADLKPLKTIQVGAAVGDVAWLGGDKVVAGCIDSNLHVFDVSSGNKIATLGPPEGHTSIVVSVAVSNNGLWIASGSGDATLRLWSARDFSPLSVQKHPDPVNAVAFFPDSSRVVTGCYDDIARVFAIPADGKWLQEVLVLKHAEPVNAVAVSPDSRVIATGDRSGAVSLWNAADGAKLHGLPGHTRVNTLSFSPDGVQLCSGSNDKTIRCWNVSSGKETAVLTGHSGIVTAVAFAPAAASTGPASKASAVAQQQQQAAAASPSSPSSPSSPTLARDPATITVADVEHRDEDELNTLFKECKVANKKVLAVMEDYTGEMFLTPNFFQLAFTQKVIEQNGINEQLHLKSLRALHQRLTGSAPAAVAASAAAPTPQQQPASGDNKQQLGLDTTRYLPIADFVRTVKPDKPCSEYVKLGAAHLPGVELIDDVIAGSGKVAQSLLEGGVDLGGKITPPQLFAVIVYTFDLCLIDPALAGQSDKNFYFQVNKVLQTRDPDKIKHLSGYLHFLMGGLQALPDFHGTVYRGLSAGAIPILSENYKMGRKVHWSGLSSTSADFAYAKMMAGPGGIVMRIKVKSGKKLGEASALPAEKEVLLLPNFAAMVTSDIEKDTASGGTLVIDLVEAAPDQTFVF